jgi:NAD(P)-dependent dehydrogenase (short-subunit alcohol dehydrogenase family)
MGKLDGKVAIVTGAGSGMGQAEAVLFAQEGAKVVVDDIVYAGGRKTVKMIKDAGGEAVFIHADVSKAADVQKIVKLAVDTYGRLDILVNNAGVQSYKPFLELTEKDLDYCIDTNLRGTFLGMKYAIPEMIKAGGGSVINISSIAADHAQMGSAVYAATKGALFSMTIVAAVEFAPQNVRVNVIKPGCIVTPMYKKVVNTQEAEDVIVKATPNGKLGQSEDVAKFALFLASDDSSHITGQKLAVDGGIEAFSHIV